MEELDTVIIRFGVGMTRDRRIDGLTEAEKVKLKNEV